ncbi:efflux RND transporter periplasmic adaptor subunit [candidate division KSB1 bacterium]
MMQIKKLNLTWAAIVILVILTQWSVNHFELTGRIFSSNNEESGRKIAYWVAPMDPAYTSDKPGKSPMGMDLVPVYEDEVSGQPAGQRTEEGVPGVDFYYSCGMHPDVHELEPGNCPICGMKLVRKMAYAMPSGNITSAGSHGRVVIDPVTVQNMGVQSVPVKTTRLTRAVRTVGTIAYDERLEASVTTKISGWAEKLYADFTGELVKEGDPLIEIYSPELVSTQEEYLRTREYAEQFEGSEYTEAAAQSRQLLASTLNRLRLWDISDEQIAELEKTGEVKKTMTLYSPITGIVTQKGLREGDRITPNMHIYKISDVSQVWVLADIYEYELPWIESGQPASMTLSYLPGKEFEGRISFIYPFLDAKTRTVKVRFEFENEDMLLKPGMYANVIIHSLQDDPHPAVPVSAVLLSGERSIVIVDLGDGRFEPREVKLGIQTGDYYSIFQGLAEGENVVVSAQFLIDSESRLREAQMKMLNPSQEEEVKTSVTIIGEGEMTHTCPMQEDMVFSSGEGDCPECGMQLEEMTPAQKARMDRLLQSHEAVHIHRPGGNTVNEFQAPDGKSITVIGEGDIMYTCPMQEDMVFSAKPVDCPVCGMHLRKMTPEDHERLRGLQEQYSVNTIR